MSDSYDVDGVTVSPQPGGYYDLSHPSLAAPERARGKETADARAKEIAAAAVVDEESHIPPQAPIAAPATGQPSASAADVEALRQQVASLNAQLQTRTVETVGAPPPAPGTTVPGAVPRKYEGTMDSATRKLMSDMGVGVVKIVLEENAEIPPTGLYVGHNGRGYMISPGVEVEVPAFLLGVLNDAKMAAPQVDPKTQKVLGYRERMRYPYRRID